jgi:hypothetical protein
LHQSKDLAVALLRRRKIHLHPANGYLQMPSPFGSGVTVRTSQIALCGRYPLPFCRGDLRDCNRPLSRHARLVFGLSSPVFTCANPSAIVWQGSRNIAYQANIDKSLLF